MNLGLSASGPTCPDWIYKTPNNNRISTSSGFVYDAAGNVMADGVHTYQWDAEGRMIQLDSGANAINDTFNAFGWRVYTTYPSIPATNYLYDPQGKFLVGYFGNWNAPVPFQGRTLAMYTEGAGEPLFFDHPNALGSEGQWTNASGGYGGELQFYPWGQEGPNTTNGNVYQYYAGLLLYDPQSDGYQTPTPLLHPPPWPLAQP